MGPESVRLMVAGGEEEEEGEREAHTSLVSLVASCIQAALATVMALASLGTFT